MPPSSPGRETFSSTVKVGIRLKNWKIKPMFWRRNRVRWRSSRAVRFWPFSQTAPSSARSMPLIRLSRVLLPLLEAVGLADRLQTFPDRLSGGEQQRVAIARALVNDPLLVLADEPTGNLDEETGRQVLALLDRLTRQAGKNLILVTHSREAAAYADRIVYLKEGKLVDSA